MLGKIKNQENRSMEPYRHFRILWQHSSTDFPVLNKNYSRKEKREREKNLDEFLFSLKEGIQKRGNLNLGVDNTWFFAKMEQFFRNGLDYDDEQLGVILSGEMIDATLDFVSEARRFDSLISADEIFQALRNAWIMNGIQYVLGQKVALTPSIFAYSMLYPYSDNIVDDPGIDTGEKLDFSARFEDRLKGNKFPALNRSEEKIHQLVAMIEDEWDRIVYPGVYRSLLAIHKAQTDSMFLLSGEKLSNDEVFRICIEKGGTSVVADGYLILGNINPGQEKFLYDYGAYLQLLDDLQDASEDSFAGLITSFSGVAGNKKIFEELLCQTFHLGFKIMDEVDLLNNCDSSAFKSLMKKSIDLFIIEAVVTNHSFFSWRFMRKMEMYSPFRFSFIKKRNSTLSPYQKMLFRNIEEFASQRGVNEPEKLLITA